MYIFKYMKVVPYTVNALCKYTLHFSKKKISHLKCAIIILFWSLNSVLGEHINTETLKKI